MASFLIFAVGTLLGGNTAVNVQDAPVLSICELTEDAAKWDGREVRIASRYVTDLRHGAFFLDKQCPKVSVQEGPLMLQPIDKSVEVFDSVKSENSLSHKLVAFDVQVIGRFRRATVGLKSAHGLSAGVSGEIVVEKVIRFTKTQAEK